MNEQGPNNLPPVEATGSGNKNRHRRKSRKSQEAASLGGLAANVIWQRESEERPKTRPLFEALQVERPDKPATEKTTKPAETTSDKEESTEKSVATTAEDTETTTPDDTPETTTADTPEDQELEASLGELNDDELHYAASQYLQVRGMEVAAEQISVEPESPEAAALNIDAEYVETMRATLDGNPDMSPEAASDIAYEQTVAEHDLSPEPIAQPVPEALIPPVAPEADGPEEPPAIPPSSGGGARPPLPPEFGPSGGAPSFPEQPAAAAFNKAPQKPVSEALSSHEAAHFERRGETRGLLVGGILGYLIGRRRGRIRTERQLKPIQARLEKQVTQLHETIAAKERQLRSAAALQVEAQRQVIAPASTSERPAATITPENTPLAPPPPPTERLQPPIFEAPAVPLAAATVAGEVVRHELATPPPAEQAPTNTPEAARPKQIGPEQVAGLTTEELVAVSAQIKVGGENLQEIYSAKRISEPGLRAIVLEYVRGGNVKKALKRELLNKELTYERDPWMRKGLSARLASAGSVVGGAGSAVATVATKAKPKIAEHSKKAKDVSKRLGTKALEQSRQLEQRNDELQRLIVRSWLGITIFLLLIVIILLIR